MAAPDSDRPVKGAPDPTRTDPGQTDRRGFDPGQADPRTLWQVARAFSLLLRRLFLADDPEWALLDSPGRLSLEPPHSYLGDGLRAMVEQARRVNPPMRPGFNESRCMSELPARGRMRSRPQKAPSYAECERRLELSGRRRRKPAPAADTGPGGESDEGTPEPQNGYNGFAGVLTPAERDDARRIAQVPVSVDVSVYRVQLKKLLRLAAETTTLEEMVQFTNAYGLALLRIARVLEAEQKRSGETDGIQAELPEILKKLNEELDNELNQQLPLF